MAACCAVGALVIYKLISIYSRLPQLTSAKLEQATAQPENEERWNVDQKNDAGPQTCRFSLHGLTCRSCVAAVERSLLESCGVQDVSISLHALTAFVTFVPTQISPREVQSAIEDTGFTAQLNANEDDWRSQWTNAVTSRQKSIREWQDAFNRSTTAGLSVFIIENFVPWIVDGEQMLVKLVEAVAHAITAISILLLAGSIHQEAFAALRHGRLTTSTLSSAGLLCVLASASLQELLGHTESAGKAPLPSACMLLTLTLGVKLIKCAVSKRSSELPTLLASTLPDTVNLLTNMDSGLSVKSIPLHLLRVGDIIQIECGAAFPGDCVIIEGNTSVLQTIINGELDPVAVQVRDIVHAGSTNCGHQVRARVLRLGKDTWLGHTLSAISKATEKKSELQNLSDRFLDWFSAIVMLLAAASVMLQIMNRESVDAILNKTASILLCACPCTMGMGIPVCLMAATRNAHDAGILLSAGPQIERAASARMIVFDKTGTLTSGNLTMQAVQLEPNWATNEALLWQLVHAMTKKSQHPVSKLLLRHSSGVLRERCKGLDIDVVSYEEIPGPGQAGQLEAFDQHYEIAIGNHRLMQARGVYLEPVVSSSGIVYVSVNGKLSMRATYQDGIIQDAAELVNELHAHRFKTFMMTGDTKGSAQVVAREVGIPLDNVYASLLPHDKASLIESLERRYGPVVMVGDNLNDAPALAAATFGIVTSRRDADEVQNGDHGANRVLQKLHQEADALLMPEISTVSGPCGLLRVTYILDLIHEASRRMHRVLQWSLMYNAVALVVVSGMSNSAMPGTTCEWRVIEPTFASLLMSLNSIATLVYCLRIEKWRPDGHHSRLRGKG